MIYEQLSKGDFRDAFKRMDRLGDFSYEGLGALYDYILEVSEETGYELDVIALCCEYSEEPIKEVLESYSLRDLEQLQDNTVVIWHDDVNVLYLNW